MFVPTNTLSKSTAQQITAAPLPLKPLPKNLQAPPGRAVLLVNECAEMLRVNAQHITNQIEEGKLIAINVGGSTRKFYRVPVEAWEAWLRKNGYG